MKHVSKIRTTQSSHSIFRGLLQKGVDCRPIQVDNKSWVFPLAGSNKKNITWSWISRFQHPKRYQYQEQGTSVFKFQMTCCSKVCLIPQLCKGINDISFFVRQYGVIIEETYDEMHKTMKCSSSPSREAPPMMVVFVVEFVARISSTKLWEKRRKCQKVCSWCAHVLYQWCPWYQEE